MERQKVLIALRDEDEALAFSDFLKAAGLEPHAVADGARALELAIQEPPAVIVADTALPVIGAERLFQILRHNPHTSAVPFLFISDGISDVKGFRTGFDIFLVRPINMEETYGRIRHALTNTGGDASKVIEGKLSHMSLPDLLQFLHMNQKEGELKLTAGQKGGSVVLKGGNIFNATVDGVEREKALFRLLQWTEGRFEFIPKAVTAPKKIRSSAGNLMMEGMRQIDEFRKREDQFPARSAVIRPKTHPLELPKGLQPIYYEIVQLVRTGAKVGDVVDRCQHPDYEAYSAISSLMAKGVLEEEKRPDDSREQVFLTTDQMISIREKILTRFSEPAGLNFGRILVAAPSGSLIAGFLKGCRRLPGFSMNTRSAFAELSLVNPLGEAGALKLYGGMELVIFSLPTVNSMGPLWTAFSSSLVGVILLWDGADETGLPGLAAAKQDVLLKRSVPVVHVSVGRQAGAEARKTLGLKPDEPVFTLSDGDRRQVEEIFYALFGNILKEEPAEA